MKLSLVQTTLQLPTKQQKTSMPAASAWQLLPDVLPSIPARMQQVSVQGASTSLGSARGGPARYLIVPGIDADRCNIPFRGTASKRVRSLVAAAGLDTQSFVDTLGSRSWTSGTVRQ